MLTCCALQFPHIICIGENRSTKTKLVKIPKFTEKQKIITPSDGGSGSGSGSGSASKGDKNGKDSKFDGDAFNSLKATAGGSVVITRHKPLIAVNKLILSRLLIPAQEYDAPPSPAPASPASDESKSPTEQPQRPASASLTSPTAATAATAAGRKSAPPAGDDDGSGGSGSGGSGSASGERSHISQINNAVLRRYFTELTEQFLKPFARYHTIEPVEWLHQIRGERWNPYLDTPVLPKFSERDFLDSLRTALEADEHPPATATGTGSGSVSGGSGSGGTASGGGSGSGGSSNGFGVDITSFPISGSLNATKRKRMVLLYQRFVRSPHFYAWLHDMQSKTNAIITHYQHLQIKRLAVLPIAPPAPPAPAPAPAADVKTPAPAPVPALAPSAAATAASAAAEAQFRQFFDGLRLSSALEMLRTAQLLHESLLFVKGGGSGLSAAAGGAAISPAPAVDEKLLAAVNSHITLITSFIPPNVLRNGVLPPDSPFAPSFTAASKSPPALSASAGSRTAHSTPGSSGRGSGGSGSGPAVSRRKMIGFGSADAIILSPSAMHSGSGGAAANRPPPVQLFVDDAKAAQQPVMLSTTTKMDLKFNDSYF